MQPWKHSPKVVVCASCGISGVFIGSKDKTWQRVGGVYFCEKEICRHAAMQSQFGAPLAMRSLYDEPPKEQRQNKPREPIQGLLGSPLEPEKSVIRNSPIRKLARIQREMERLAHKQPSSWLEELQREIWDRKEYTAYGQAEVVRFESKRKIHPEELKRVKVVVDEHGYPCVMINTRFGFGLGVTIWDMPPTPGAPPELLLTISDEHLHLEEEGKWDKAWEVFSELTHSEQNISRCEFAGLEKPKPKDFYVY